MFDINKYKDWYWCESSGIYNDYFAEIEGTEELPIEFAKELITDCDDLIPIEGKPNHYKKYSQEYVDNYDYAIYIFKGKVVFKQVIKKFEEYFNFGRIFKFANISEKYFLEKSKENTIEDKNVIKCSQWIINEMLDLGEDYNAQFSPITFKKYLSLSLGVLNKIKKTDYIINLINVGEDILSNNEFLYYHNFLDLAKKFYD